MITIRETAGKIDMRTVFYASARAGVKNTDSRSDESLLRGGST